MSHSYIESKGNAVAQVLFYIGILFEVGMLVSPLIASTRGNAVFRWICNLLVSSILFTVLEEYLPSWEEPRWHAGTEWKVVVWVLFVSGFVVAVRKPRRHAKPVA